MAQMQTFSFAPPNMGIGDNKKNYVFVDEHNRHKRLKVMRACEGCRRRKIKCDAATTNAWPCAACVRLKLNCVPPTINYDRTHAPATHISGLERVLDFDASSHSGDEDLSHQLRMSQVFELEDHGTLNSHQGVYDDVFHTPPYSEGSLSNPEYPYDDVHNIPQSSYQDHSSFNQSSSSTFNASNEGSWTSEQYTAADLSSVLGKLKIDEDGIAPYISQQKKVLAEAPALEEYEVKLPPTPVGSGSTVKIPQELMPSEEQSTKWFETFFLHIHPYVPVLSKPYFYQQWRTNRESISPLILEAIFACAGRMSADPAQGAQWLALASKHETCFMDVPRLSTIQALLLLLKAREAAPKRGYYYRSWMTIKTIVTMAKDLELHQHYADHQANRECGSDPTECLIKTRIWQTIFICEIMVGGPQGRHDFDVDPDTVDISIQRALPGVDTSDHQISRQFTYMVRLVRQIRVLNNTYRKVTSNKQKDWGSNPLFAKLNPSVSRWMDDLPSDLQVTFPEDASTPWLSSHFVGNMHSHYHLLVIMLHRPQLMDSDSFSAGGSWKQHMALCYSSAKAMCKLQESLLQTFGLIGFLCMQRGINFVIYAVLTCTMIHLVAITSPDPEFNTDAKDYFTRHMRILERCTSAWPMQDMQNQIDALREAFSADTSKPFELKPSFPYGSPSGKLQPSPPLDVKYQHPAIGHHESHEPAKPVQYHLQHQPITPPISVDHSDHDGSLAMIANCQQQQPMLINTDPLVTNHTVWNPTPIFDQWNTAFEVPSSVVDATNSSLPQISPPLYPSSTIKSNDITPLNDAMQQQQQYSVTSGISSLPRAQPTSSHTSYTSAGPSFVTSSMWRDTVASTFDPNALKRRWDLESSFIIDPAQSKRPR